MHAINNQATAIHEVRKASACRILLAEDDEMLARFVVRLLTSEGYQVTCAFSGTAVLQHLPAGFDLLVLDLNLPELDGLSILRQLRASSTSLPVLVLTGRNRSEGMLPALNSGADDCMLKPFSYLELLARIRILLRRQGTPAATSTSYCADLVLNRDRTFVQRGDRRIELTQREFSLLEYLMRIPETPVSRSVLLQEVWGASSETSTNVVDVYMKYVRDKVDLPGLPRLVRTVRGTGYMVSAA